MIRFPAISGRSDVLELVMNIFVLNIHWKMCLRWGHWAFYSNRNSPWWNFVTNCEIIRHVTMVTIFFSLCHRLGFVALPWKYLCSVTKRFIRKCTLISIMNHGNPYIYFKNKSMYSVAFGVGKVVPVLQHDDPPYSSVLRVLFNHSAIFHQACL